MKHNTLNRPPIVGLTGNIGSGKSEAALEFQSLGARVIDADMLAREAVLPGGEALREISSAFGPAVIFPSGELNRQELGRIIFSDPQQRRRLEDILHPRIRALYLQRLAEACSAPTPLVVYVVPLLFESRFSYPELDAIVVVSAPKELAIQRVISRDKCSKPLAEQKYAAQIPIEDKERKADFVIRNDGSLESLRLQVRSVFAKVAAADPPGSR